MVRKSNPDDPDWIDALLQDVADPPDTDTAPPPGLMARVLADAEAAMPPPGGAVPGTPLWQQIVRGLGGWGAVGGMVAAAVFGFAVGLGSLDAVGLGVDDVWSLTGLDAGYDATGLDALGWDFEEGDA